MRGTHPSRDSARRAVFTAISCSSHEHYVLHALQVSSTVHLAQYKPLANTPGSGLVAVKKCNLDTFDANLQVCGLVFLQQGIPANPR